MEAPQMTLLRFYEKYRIDKYSPSVGAVGDRLYKHFMILQKSMITLVQEKKKKKQDHYNLMKTIENLFKLFFFKQTFFLFTSYSTADFFF